MMCWICHTDVPVIKLDTHDKDCLACCVCCCLAPGLSHHGKVVKRGYNVDPLIERWDGISPVVFKELDMTSRPAVTKWNGSKFYLMIGIVDGKVLFYAGADGGEEVRKKFKLEVSLENPGNGSMEIVSVSQLVPVD